MYHHRLSALALGFLALAILSPAVAQTWRGSEVIGVQASSSKGKPIAGARVVLTYQGRGSEASPPDVETNQKGRAVIAGLAQGPWQIEVQHPDFLSYVALFDLQRGKKPSVSASFLEAGGRSLTPMKVKLSKGNPRDASPPLSTREARTQTLPPAEPDRTTEESKIAASPPTVETAPPEEPMTAEQPSPSEDLTPEPKPEPEVQAVEEPSTIDARPPIEEPEIAAVQEPEIPKPLPEPSLESASIEPEPELQTDTLVEPAEQLPEAQTTTPGAPEPSTPGPIEEEPVQEPTRIMEQPMEETAEREPVEVPPEPTDRPVVPSVIVEESPRQEPLPEPAIVTEEQVEVEAPPAPELEAPVAAAVPSPWAPAAAAPILTPDDTPAISSYRDGICAECRTGEWAVTADQTVAAGSTLCPGEVAREARQAADGLSSSMQLELSGFVGPTADGSSGEALTSVEPEVAQAFRQQLAPYLGATSNCQVVSVVLPKSVRFAGFRYEAFDDGGGGQCMPDQGCLISRARWLASPVVQRGFNATVVYGIFENMAADKQRFARLKVYFRPPNARWQPPTR